MAHTIKLKFGSPTSWSYIDLTDSSHGNIDYYPRTAGADADDITESGAFRVAGSSVADLIAKINEIESVFYKARAYDLEKIGAYQAFVTLQPDGIAETWESQIYDGRLELTDNIFGVDWANRHTDVVLIWRRAPYWERYVQIPISNSNGSGNSTAVYNFGDGIGTAPTKQENWVDIAAGVVDGDLPAPTAIVFSGIGANAFSNALVINNVNALPTASVLAEGENGTGGDINLSTLSGGKYHNYIVPAGNANGINVTKQVYFPISSGARLRYFLSVFLSDSVRAKPFFTLGGLTYTGPTSILAGGTLGFNLYDLGLLRLPEGDSTNHAGFSGGLDLVVVGVNLSTLGSAVTASVDYFLYVPTDYFAKGYFTAGGAGLVIMDTRNNKLIANINYPAQNIVHSVGTLYGGIYLEPGKAQRLHFKFSDYMGDSQYLHATVAVNSWLRKRTV